MAELFRALKKFRARASEAGVSWIAHLRWLNAWSRGQRKGGSSIADESPWMTFGAIHRLRGALARARGEARVFEWGSGGSTIFFARRAHSVVAVENDRAWAEKVRQACAERGLQRATVHYVPGEPAPGGDPSDPQQFASASMTHSGETFRAYAETIASHPNESLDIVVVDGRARPACLRLAMPKLKPGGLLVLDNSDRAWYARARALADAWPRASYRGPGPYCPQFWETTIWQRPR
jgi:predicted O-methyltransferase YrrM